MDEAQKICALLLHAGALPRARLPGLGLPDIRESVEKRLANVGLELATSAYSDHVGLRLLADVTAEDDFDAASNVGLHADHCALLVILWARLVLQKRTASDTHDVPGQASLLVSDRRAAADAYVPRVRLETLAQEFPDVLGSRSRIKTLVARLRKLGFVAGRGDVYEAGPFLELGIDGNRMMTFIRREVLAGLVARMERDGADATVGADTSEAADQIIAVIERLGGSVAMKELSAETGEKADRLRPLLRELEERRRIRRTGERATTRYHLVET